MIKDHNACPQCECNDKRIVSFIETKKKQERNYQCLKCTNEWTVTIEHKGDGFL